MMFNALIFGKHYRVLNKNVNILLDLFCNPTSGKTHDFFSIEFVPTSTSQ